MKINWKSIISVANPFLQTLIPGVAQVETLAVELVKNGKNLTGQEKSAAVLELALSSLSTVEHTVHKNLLNDEKVKVATQSIIDSVVKFHDVLADVQSHRVHENFAGKASGPQPITMSER